MVDINLAYNLSEWEMMGRLRRQENITALEEIILSDIGLYKSLINANHGKKVDDEIRITDYKDAKRFYLHVKKIVEECLGVKIKKCPELALEPSGDWFYIPPITNPKILWVESIPEDFCLGICHELGHHVLMTAPELRDVKLEYVDLKWIAEGFARSVESQVAGTLSEKEGNIYYWILNLEKHRLRETISVYSKLQRHINNQLNAEERWRPQIRDFVHRNPQIKININNILNDHELGTAVYSIAEQRNPQLLEDILSGKLSVLRI